MRIDRLARQLNQALDNKGWVSYKGIDGNRLFLIKSSLLEGYLEQGLLVSYEGGGSIFCKDGEYISYFKLVGKGLPVALARVLERVFYLNNAPSGGTKN